MQREVIKSGKALWWREQTRLIKGNNGTSRCCSLSFTDEVTEPQGKEVIQQSPQHRSVVGPGFALRSAHPLPHPELPPAVGPPQGGSHPPELLWTLPGVTGS